MQTVHLLNSILHNRPDYTNYYEEEKISLDCYASIYPSFLVVFVYVNISNFVHFSSQKQKQNKKSAKLFVRQFPCNTWCIQPS